MAMAEAQLPEEIVVHILSRLPVKSLVRFSCVSKRLHSIIFSDPKFARSQFEAASEQRTLSRRLLISTDAPKLESLDFETPSFGDDSSVRKLNFPLQPPGGSVRLLGSCNGLVIVYLGDEFFYIWNPCIGFVKQLPNPGFSSNENEKDLIYYGFGYLSATDNYKILLGSFNWTDQIENVDIFSLRAHVWKTIQLPGDPNSLDQGILVNESLHWLSHTLENEIVVFDLAAEEFRKMRQPNFHQVDDLLINLGVSLGGCLCVCRRPLASYDIDLWVMREYDLHGDSWTKLFNFKLSNPPEVLWHCSRDVFVMESSVVYQRRTGNGVRLVRIDHSGEEQLDKYKTEGNCVCMIPYEDSLLWISD